jgi:hypothetical protein
MCQAMVEWLFDPVLPSHIRKVASLSAQALSVFIELGNSEMTCFLAKYMMPEAE